MAVTLPGETGYHLRDIPATIYSGANAQERQFRDLVENVHWLRGRRFRRSHWARQWRGWDGSTNTGLVIAETKYQNPAYAEIARYYPITGPAPAGVVDLRFLLRAGSDVPGAIVRYRVYSTGGALVATAASTINALANHDNTLLALAGVRLDGSTEWEIVQDVQAAVGGTLTMYRDACTEEEIAVAGDLD